MSFHNKLSLKFKFVGNSNFIHMYKWIYFHENIVGAILWTVLQQKNKNKKQLELNNNRYPSFLAWDCNTHKKSSNKLFTELSINQEQCPTQLTMESNFRIVFRWHLQAEWFIIYIVLCFKYSLYCTQKIVLWNIIYCWHVYPVDVKSVCVQGHSLILYLVSLMTFMFRYELYLYNKYTKAFMMVGLTLWDKVLEKCNFSFRAPKRFFLLLQISLYNNISWFLRPCSAFQLHIWSETFSAVPQRVSRAHMA